MDFFFWLLSHHFVHNWFLLCDAAIWLPVREREREKLKRLTMWQTMRWHVAIFRSFIYDLLTNGVRERESALTKISVIGLIDFAHLIFYSAISITPMNIYKYSTIEWFRKNDRWIQFSSKYCSHCDVYIYKYIHI